MNWNQRSNPFSSLTYTHCCPSAICILDSLTSVPRIFTCPLIVQNTPWSNVQNAKEFIKKEFINELHFYLNVRKWFSFSWFFFLGILAVIDAYDTSYRETKQGETPGASSDLNRLDKDPIYVGGLPRSRIVRYFTCHNHVCNCQMC